MASDDLHARLVAEVTRRLEVARAATPGPWTTSGPDSIAQWMIHDRQWCVATATAYDHDQPLSNWPGATGPGYIDPDANAAHIALHDPADAIRRYQRDLSVLAQHRPREQPAGLDPAVKALIDRLDATMKALCVGHGLLSSDVWPCVEVRHLAASLGIEVTDG